MILKISILNRQGVDSAASFDNSAIEMAIVSRFLILIFIEITNGLFDSVAKATRLSVITAGKVVNDTERKMLQRMGVLVNKPNAPHDAGHSEPREVLINNAKVRVHTFENEEWKTPQKK